MTVLLIGATWEGVEYEAGECVPDDVAHGIHLMAWIYNTPGYEEAVLTWAGAAPGRPAAP